jgi:hypothetical protein
MWEGYSEHAWAQTALLAALAAEPHRDPKRRSRPFSSDDFNPHAPKRPPHKGALKATPQLLASVFCNGERR